MTGPAVVVDDQELELDEDLVDGGEEIAALEERDDFDDAVLELELAPRVPGPTPEPRTCACGATFASALGGR